MATKSEIVQWFHDNFPNIQTVDKGLVVLFATKNGRSRKVYVEILDSIISMESPFGEESNGPAGVILAAVSKLTKLGMGMTGKFYVLRHVIPTSNLDTSEIDFGIKTVAHDADEIEFALGGDSF